MACAQNAPADEVRNSRGGNRRCRVRRLVRQRAVDRFGGVGAELTIDLEAVLPLEVRYGVVRRATEVTGAAQRIAKPCQRELHRAHDWALVPIPKTCSPTRSVIANSAGLSGVFIASVAVVVSILNSTRSISRRTFANHMARSCKPFGIVLDFGLPQLIAREIARRSLLSA